MRIRLGMPRSRGEWVFTILGAAMAVGSAVPLVQGVLSLAWPTVDGVILHSQGMSGYRAMGVDIAYQYAVSGHTYTGNRFRFQFVLTADRMDGRDVQSIIGRYRAGEPVKVAVDPGNPSSAVLDPGPDLESLVPFGMGLFLLLLGVAKAENQVPLHGTQGNPLVARPRFLAAKLLSGVGVALLLYGANNLYRGIVSTQWPSVQGRILYSSARTGSNSETLLWYEYHVGDTRYLASKYRNGGNVTPFDGVAEAAAKRYPAGRTLPVYYDPGNPQEALLEPGLWWGNFVAPAFAFVLFGAAWLAKRLAEVMK